MSCILRVSGTNLEPAKLLRESPLVIDRSWNRGAARRLGGPGSHQINERGGFTIVVSDGDRVPQQVEDAVEFLSKNVAQLETVLLHESVEDRFLDFACMFSVGDAAPAAQFCHFSADLIVLCARLRLGLEVSVYASADERGAE
jgi:hypothetical protein